MRWQKERQLNFDKRNKEIISEVICQKLDRGAAAVIHFAFNKPEADK